MTKPTLTELNQAYEAEILAHANLVRSQIEYREARDKLNEIKNKLGMSSIK